MDRRDPRQQSTRRQWLRASLALPALALGVNAQTPSPVRPNVVLILSDDQGFGDAACYGSPDIRTPHLDAIAKRGVRFTRFYANAPECTPTRTALLTGRYPQRVGGLECAIGVGNIGRYDEAVWLRQRNALGLPAAESELARSLKNAGYATACFGKWHLGYEPEFAPRRHGFDTYFGPLGGTVDYFTHQEPTGEEMLYRNEQPTEESGYLTDLITREAVSWIPRQEQPFFLYLPYTSPHTPIQDSDDTDKVATAENWNRGDWPTYVRMVEHLDAAVGKIVQALGDAGQLERTLLVFASDNGATRLGDNGPYRGNKGQLFEGGIRVPCLMQWPGTLPAGKSVSFPALTMDLSATILAACGAPPRRAMDGMDLMPLLRGDQAPPAERRLFFRYKRLENRRKAVMEGDWKYIVDNGEEHLYHLGRDPGETKNLLASAQPDAPISGQTATIAERLRQQLEAWEREVEAPRLREFRAATAP